MAAAYPAGNPGNTYVPSFDASGQLVVAYSRNPKDFALNQYVTIQPVKKSSGYYLQITPEVAARVLNSDLKDNAWTDGNDAPAGEWGLESFEFKQFETRRFAFPFRIGYKSEQQADWKILASHSAMYAQQAMTARVRQVASLITTSGNWPTGHFDTLTNLGGGLVGSGTATDPRWKKALMAVLFKINKDTLGAVGAKDLVVVIDPVTADTLARSQEVHTYLKESPYALAQVRGDSENQNGMWGLPDQLYGFKHVVDDTVVITQKKGGTAAPAYVYSNNAIVLARPGQLTAAEGSKSFGTVHLFMYEEMTVEQRDDPDNRRIAARIVEDYDQRIVAPVSGYLITNTVS